MSIRYALQRNLLWMAFLACCWLAGCGYSFVGSGTLPAGIKSLHVAVVGNPTAETGLENIVTQALVDELTRRKHPLVAAGKSDAVLGGRIENLWLETVTHKGGTVSQERRVRLALSLNLTNRAGENIWTSGLIMADWTFDVVAGNKAATEQNRHEALVEVAKRLAETAYSRLTNQF